MDIGTAITIVLVIRVHAHVDINDLIRQFRNSPTLVPADIKINVSDEIKLSENISISLSSSMKPVGSLSMVKKTKKPEPKELELIQAARGDRQYNSIFDIEISYDENGNITSIKWSEN